MFVLWRRFPALHVKPRHVPLLILAGLGTAAAGIAWRSHFGVSAGCALLIWGFLFVPGRRHVVLDGLKKIGDASYCLYISHTVVGLPIAYVVLDYLEVRARVGSGEWGLSAIGLSILWSTTVSVLGALIVHRNVERPMVGFLLRLGQAKAPSRAMAGSVSPAPIQNSAST